MESSAAKQFAKRQEGKDAQETKVRPDLRRRRTRRLSRAKTAADLFCPTGSYEMTAEGVADWSQFGMTHCGECGMCRYICPVDAIDWSYPEGGTGKIHAWA